MSETIITVPIKEEVEQSLLDYGMSIITDRALPSAEDGLKPVNRRILYDMFDKGFLFNKHSFSLAYGGGAKGVVHRLTYNSYAISQMSGRGIV